MAISINDLCAGLETGTAEVLQRATPATAELLRWWFGRAPVQSRAGLNFSPAQRRALLGVIVAHELGIDRAPPPGALTVPLRAGEGRVRVLLALLSWQLLNQHDAQASGVDDPRFTRHLMVVAPHPATHERLLAALCGQPLPGGAGARDFGASDWVRMAELLLPPHRRDTVWRLVCASVCSGSRIASHAADEGVIAITGGRLDALECLARWPQLMVLDDGSGVRPARARGFSPCAWREQLHRMLATREGHGLHVVLAGR